MKSKEGESAPIQGARFVHTNLIARDWRRLAGFYEEVFGCERVPPERDYAGPALEAGTGIRDARIRGVHLRLPGHLENGPTLEIYQYDASPHSGLPHVNGCGFGHIAFEVDDVGQARQRVLAEGGAEVGEVVTLTNAHGAEVVWCYVRDPEGNIVELQSWG